MTLFGIFLTPVFYVVIRWFTERKGGAGEMKEADDARAAEVKKVEAEEKGQPETMAKKPPEAGRDEPPPVQPPADAR